MSTTIHYLPRYLEGTMREEETLWKEINRLNWIIDKIRVANPILVDALERAYELKQED